MEPRWSTLRTVGRSRLARATIFIPLVGYLFIFNSEIVGFFHLLPIFSGDQSSKAEIEGINLSRLICIYIGLFCIGIGSIIFAVFCPSEIADNLDEHEFTQKELDMMTPFRFEMTRARLAQFRKLGSDTLKAEIDRLAGVELSDTIGFAGMRTTDLGTRGLLWGDWLNRNKGNLASGASVHYQLLDSSLPILRLGITIFYAAGAFFLLLPSAQVFIKAVLLVKSIEQFLFRL
jgi:hypothetical protein